MCLASAAMGPATVRADVQSCIDAAESGQKLRDAGSYGGAREQFIACAADECPGEVRKACVGWLGDVEKLIPTLVFSARARGAEVTDVRVEVDGKVVATRIDGKPVFVDPGEHSLRFERAGEPAIDLTVVVLAGEKARLVSVEFDPEPPAATVAPASTAPPPVAPAPPAKGAAYGLAAAAIAGFALGATLDISGYAFLQTCRNDPSCTGGHERAEVAWRFVAGDTSIGAGLVSGVVSWLLWSRGVHASAKLPAAQIHVYRTGNARMLGVSVAF